jgi:predicted DCC family thiol-disulfide oxidoreductase YuxK
MERFLASHPAADPAPPAVADAPFATPAAPPAAPAAPRDVILFDGVCDLCNTGAAWVRTRDREGRFEFVPYQEPAVAARFPGLDPARLAAEMHVVTAEGQVLRGVDAGARVLRALPGWSWAGRALGSAWLGWAARPVYRWVARWRRGLFGGAAGDLSPGKLGCKISRP